MPNNNVNSGMATNALPKPTADRAKEEKKTTQRTSMSD
jgi:hypothetical protein